LWLWTLPLAMQILWVIYECMLPFFIILLMVWFLSDFFRINWVLMVFNCRFLGVVCALYIIISTWWDVFPLEILLHSLSFLLCLNNNLPFIDLFKKCLFIYVLILVGLKFKFVIIGKNWVCFRICDSFIVDVFVCYCI